MGVYTPTSSNTTYYRVTGGKLVQSVQEGTPGAESRVNKNGKTVYEKNEPGWTGHITNVSVEINEEFGDNLVIEMKDSGGFQANIKAKLRSGYAKAFLKRLPNINFEIENTLCPGTFETEDGKTRSYIAVFTNNGKVEPAFTRDEPNGLPQLELVKFQGKETWDDTKQMEFFMDMLNTDIKEKIAKANYNPVGEAAPDVNPGVEIDDDSLPF